MPVKPFVKILLLFAVLTPISTEGAVIINEVAWMGGSASANHEWIELYNDGSSAVDVTNWTLGDGVNLDIKLVGVIEALSYGVLERSSDEVISTPALTIYTGALVNTGGTLTLRDASGAIVDQVYGGEGWQEIGGDNTTKETAQYTTNGWITAEPTPGKQNKIVGSVKEEVFVADKNSNETKTSSLTKPKTQTNKKMVRSSATLNLALDIPENIYVNQTNTFKVQASGISDTVIKSLDYTWNFGDSYAKSGEEVEHTYAYAGNYVVTVSAKYAERDEFVRQEIVVLPVAFSITKNQDGDIQIHNNSPYEVDVSGYVVVGDKNMTLPPMTVMLANSTITIAKERLQDNNKKLIALYDDKQKLLASTFSKLKDSTTESFGVLSANVLAEAEVVPVTYSASAVETSSKLDKSFSFVQTEDLPREVPADSEEKVENFSNGDNNLKEVIGEYDEEKTKQGRRDNWAFWLFLSLLTLVLVGLYLGRSKG